MSTNLESRYKEKVIQRILKRFPGAFLLKNDSEYIQGIPDWTLLFENKWAILEIKRSSNAMARPNQPYYINLFDRMSYGSFLNPENEDEVMHGLEHTFFN